MVHACWSKIVGRWERQTERGNKEYALKTIRGQRTLDTLLYLPCLSGNSPAIPDNLDQSARYMNPHLTGAPDKISRPFQRAQDWRHEISFSVLDSLLFNKNKKMIRAKEKEGGWVCHCTLPSHPFAVELRQQLVLVMRSPFQHPKAATFEKQNTPTTTKQCTVQCTYGNTSPFFQSS